MEINNKDLRLLREVLELARYSLLAEASNFYKLQILDLISDREVDKQTKLLDKLDSLSVLGKHLDECLRQRDIIE